MNWLAAVTRRVKSASSVAGNGLGPVCSQALTSPSVVRSPNAIALLRHRHEPMGGERRRGRRRHRDDAIPVRRVDAAPVRARPPLRVTELDRALRRGVALGHQPLPILVMTPIANGA